MDTDLRDELDRCFGDGPPIDDHALLITRGHAAVRRRRLAEGASVATVAAAVTVIALLSTGDRTGSTSPAPAGGPPATHATAPDSTSVAPDDQDADVAMTVDADLPPGEDLELLRDGVVHVIPGISVVQTIANPFDRKDPTSSAGVVYSKDGETIWWVGYVADDGGGASAASPPRAGTTFRDWAERQASSLQDTSGTAPDPDAGGPWPGNPALRFVHFVGDTEQLRPASEISILEQRAHPALPDSFATAADRSAVAEVEVEGVRWYVLARHLAGDPKPQYISVESAKGGATLDDFLDLARERYAEGGGGLL